MNKETLFQLAKQADLSDIELRIRKSKTTSLEVYEQTVDSFTISECKGIRARGIYDGKMGSCYLEEDADEHIPWIISSIKQNAQAITSDDEVEIYQGDEIYPEICHTKNQCLANPVEQKIELLKMLEQALQDSDARIAQVMNVLYQDIETSTQIVNSKGLTIQRDDMYSIISASILVKDGDDQKSAYEVTTLSSLEQFDIQHFVNELKNQAIKKLHATQIESGMYEVLMEKEAMASLLGSLTGLFHGENAYKGISLLKDKVGSKIFDSQLTILDDPLLVDGYNSASFDDEGVASKTKTLVKDGILMGYLHNLKSSHMMKTTSTANGFDGGIQPTNFAIENGTMEYQDMIRSIKKGVIITELNGLHAGLNPITTQFSLQAAGFYVENGTIIKPINLITIAGNFLELMKKIIAIGNDQKYQLSGIGSPSILFPSIAVSGE